MKKTNILIEVSDELYDNVVYPMKRQKRFSKLVVMLLEGYYSNDYINAYIDGSVDVDTKAGIDALDSVLNDMKSTISLMGMNTSELEQNTNEGLDLFSNKGTENKGTGSKDTGNNDTGNNGAVNNNAKGILEKPSGYVSSDEFNKLRAEFEEAKRQNENIMNMLNSIMKMGVSNPVAVEESVVSTESVVADMGTNMGTEDLSISGMDDCKVPVDEEENKGTQENTKSTFDMSLFDDVSVDIDFGDEEDEEESTDTTDLGSDIFADLMSDAVYEF